MEAEDDDLTQLARFVAHRDEAAFRALVERHSPMVRGVALRCLADVHLADDVMQAVFIRLARKASSVRGRLVGWLHTTAVLEARNARRKRDRHSQKLTRLRMETPDSPANPAPEAAWADVWPHLDEGIAALGSRPRELLLMRFFERRPLSEIARCAGKTEEACRKEISRCLQKLADRLRRRGVRVSGPALLVLLGAEALSAPVAHAAVVAAVATAAVPAATTATLGSTLYLMTASQTLKLTALALVLAAVPTVWLWRENAELKQQVRTLTAERTPRATPPPPPRPRVATVKPAAAVSEPAPTAPAASAPTPEEEKAAANRAKAAAFIDGVLGFVRNAVRPEAQKELEKLALLLPDLTPEQRSRITDALERHNTAKIDALGSALKTDILSRLLASPPTLTEADQAAIKNLQAMEKHDPLEDILTPAQFAAHTAAREQRRVGDAEAKAAETLKKLGENFTLTDTQKDAIFQSVAANELRWTGPGDEELIGPARDFARDEERARLIRSQLTPEQAEYHDRRAAEDKERALQFLQLFSGKGGQPAKNP